MASSEINNQLSGQKNIDERFMKAAYQTASYTGGQTDERRGKGGNWQENV